MKVKIKKESDKLYTVITVLMLLVFWFHYLFLVIDYYLILLIGLACIICIAVLWLIAFYAAKKKINIGICIKIAISLYLFCWVAIYSYGFVVQFKKEKYTYVVPLNGYYTRRINGVVFYFEGDKFDRKYDIQELADKHGRELFDSHEVHLTLTKILPDVYYINNISVQPKSLRN